MSRGLMADELEQTADDSMQYLQGGNPSLWVRHYLSSTCVHGSLFAMDDEVQSLRFLARTEEDIDEVLVSAQPH